MLFINIFIKMMSFVRFLIVFIIISTCDCHTVHLGRTCPHVVPFPGLDMDKLLGMWYVLHQFDTSNTCMQWNISRSQDDPEGYSLTEHRQLCLLDAVGVDHTQSLTAPLTVLNPEIPALMRVRWPTSLTGSASFTVFDTDYEQYVAIFQCDRAGFLHRRDATILSRKPHLKEKYVERVRRLLDTAYVYTGALNPIDQTNCKKHAKHNWHLEGKLFGLMGHSSSPKGGALREEGASHRDFRGGPQTPKINPDYDPSEVELVGEQHVRAIFRGSLAKPRPHRGLRPSRKPLGPMERLIEGWEGKKEKRRKIVEKVDEEEDEEKFERKLLEEIERIKKEEKKEEQAEWKHVRRNKKLRFPGILKSASY